MADMQMTLMSRVERAAEEADAKPAPFVGLPGVGLLCGLTQGLTCPLPRTRYL